MKILKLKISDYMLFKSAEIEPHQINLAQGINKDNPRDSSNGSGKSTLFKLAIIFLLYGDACGKKLNRLIRDGKKECIVEGEIEHLGNTYHIIRKVPNELQIFVNEVNKEFNTPTIGQSYLNQIFGDYDFFKKFCLVDNKGINVLDSLEDLRSIKSFKKELMQFITDEFEPIREDLLKDKNDREIYNVDKKLYKFFLSETRTKTLEKGLQELQEESHNIQKSEEEQTTLINNLKSKDKALNSQIDFLNEQEETILKNIEKNKISITQCQDKIKSLQNQLLKEKITPIDYNAQIEDLEKELSNKKKKLEKIEKFIEDLNKEIETIHFEEHTINSSLEEHSLNRKKTNEEIAGLDNIQIGTKCDKCGSVVSAEYKDSYREEKIKTMTGLIEEDKKLNLSLEKLKTKLSKIQQDLERYYSKKKEVSDNIDYIRQQTKESNDLKFKQAEEIKSQESEKTQIESNTINNQNLIQTYQEQIQSSLAQIDKNKLEITSLTKEIENIKKQIIEEENCISYYKDLYNNIQLKIERTKEFIMKVKEAQKFSAYKYTKTDIQLYADAIKTLDSFSGFYISEWMSNLSLVINDLLKNVNLSIKLTDEKEFIKIYDGEKELTYAGLSSGQQTFLSAVFKLGILLQKGESNRIIIMDDGLGSLDEFNFKNLIEICQGLPFQFFIIFQDVPKIENLNYINIERKNGESKIL